MAFGGANSANLCKKSTLKTKKTMKNTIKALVTASQFLTDNTPLVVGTPSPELVAEVLSIADRLTFGLPDLKHVDYEYKDFSTTQDGENMSHVITAEFHGKPMVCAVHGDLVMAIVKFTMELKKHTQALECSEVRDREDHIVTDAFLSQNETSDLRTVKVA